MCSITFTSDINQKLINNILKYSANLNNERILRMDFYIKEKKVYMNFNLN